MRKISKEDLLEVDFSSETPATINQLRAAFAIQRMFEREACGFKFKFMKSFKEKFVDCLMIFALIVFTLLVIIGCIVGVKEFLLAL